MKIIKTMKKTIKKSKEPVWFIDNGHKSVIFTDDMIEDNVGFVYIITNITKKKKYIGKKLFTKSKRYQKNNKKRSKRVESDWKTYTGSNDELNRDIASGDKIEKVIIALCKSKGWMSYLETQAIFIFKALLDENYYNTWVSVKIRNTHLK